jgi:hypothetical protein
MQRRDNPRPTRQRANAVASRANRHSRAGRECGYRQSVQRAGRAERQETSTSSLTSHMSTEARVPGVSAGSIALNA